MSTSPETGTRDNLLKIVLMIAACFAIGSVGFFFAVLLQHSSQKSITDEGVIQTIQVKQDAAMQSLATSEQSASASSSRSAALPSQADSGDKNAATKLKVLESLSAQ